MRRGWAGNIDRDGARFPVEFLRLAKESLRRRDVPGPAELGFERFAAFIHRAAYGSSEEIVGGIGLGQLAK